METSCSARFDNEDVLRYILEQLPRQDSLSLSMTSRSIRQSCMQSLFGFSRLHIYAPETVIDSEKFMPKALRPYVHTLRLVDICPDQRYGKIRIPLYFTDNSLLCGAFPADALADRLKELPRLHCLTLRRKTTAVHGLPWSTLSAVLSVPHLRELRISSFHFCPVLRPSEQLNITSMAQLTSFQYYIGYPSKSTTSPTEASALAAVLGRLCATLESLVLAPEPVPPSTLAQFHWPRLRELVFYGSAWPSVTMPPISLCLATQGLRNLSINLNDSTPHMLCPPDHDHTYAWNNLERLSISSPDPRDGIYDHLPSTLRTLSLRYWPHFCAQQYYWDIQYVVYEPSYGAVLRSAAVLSILRRCHIPELDCLELEYRADDDDDALWQYITSAFPRLTRLTILRLRSVQEQEEKRDVSVAHLAELLMPLTWLRSLKLYLNFVATPRPKRGPMVHVSPDSSMYDEDEISKFQDVVLDAATVLAGVLGTSLNEVAVYTVGLNGPYWRTFDVSAGYAVGRTVLTVDGDIM